MEPDKNYFISNKKGERNGFNFIVILRLIAFMGIGKVVIILVMINRGHTHMHQLG